MYLIGNPKKKFARIYQRISGENPAGIHKIILEEVSGVIPKNIAEGSFVEIPQRTLGDIQILQSLENLLNRPVIDLNKA